MQYDVIDDFLPNSYFTAIKNRITSQDFCWNFKKDITYPNQAQNKFDKRDLYGYGFDHFIVDEGKLLDSSVFEFMAGFFGALLDVSQKSQILKSRIDMTLYAEPKYKHTPHVDIYGEHVVTIFYVINSDGETELYDKTCYSEKEYSNVNLNDLVPAQKIEPKENRLLIFNGKYLHTGHSPSKNKNRILINTDLV